MKSKLNVIDTKSKYQENQENVVMNVVLIMYLSETAAKYDYPVCTIYWKFFEK